MALKERLDALRHPEPAGPGSSELGLSVIPGRQPAADVPLAPTPTPDESPQKPARGPNTFAATKAAIHALLVERHADEIDIGDREGVRKLITSLTDEYARTASVPLTRLDYGHLLDALLDEVLGLGPLQPLLEDPAISEVMINHARQVFVERGGRVMLSHVVFESDVQLRQVIDRVVSSVGRRVDESSPMCDARLRDGSRVNVVLPPLAIDGPCMTIRKFSREKLRPADLLAMGSATDDMMRFLEAAVRSRLSVLVSGGTSSGKTTLLNIISGYIPTDERIVTIEDAAELQLRQTHVIRLEARPPNIEGKGAIEIRDLVRNALRMRPDRIVVGECRGGEAMDMLQAMNTGHEGSMATIHANTPRDAISRLEQMIGMAGMPMTVASIRGQIAAAIRVIVQLQRLSDGKRCITSIAELTGLEGDIIQMQEIYRFVRDSTGEDGTVHGHFQATGIRPRFLSDLVAKGIVIPGSYFDPNKPL